MADVKVQQNSPEEVCAWSRWLGASRNRRVPDVDHRARPLALPMALLDLLMAIGSMLVRTEPLQCTACGEPSKVEKEVNVVTCPHCELPIRREGTSWVRV
jgi:hypothetical protein